MIMISYTAASAVYSACRLNSVFTAAGGQRVD